MQITNKTSFNKLEPQRIHLKDYGHMLKELFVKEIPSCSNISHSTVALSCHYGCNDDIMCCYLRYLYKRLFLAEHFAISPWL